MNRLLSQALVSLALLATAGLGCHHNRCKDNANCGGGPSQGHGCKHCKGKHNGETITMSGDQAAAASGQAVYPYYQLRGPRDFLQP